MRRSSNIGSQLLFISVLHCFMTYDLFELQFGGHPRQDLYFPIRKILFLAAVSTVCIMVLLRIIARGTTTERVFAAALLVLPILSLIYVVNLTLEMMRPF